MHNGKIPVSVFTSAPHVFQHIVSRARNNIKVVADIDNTMLFSDKTLKQRPLGSSIIKYLTDQHGAEVTYSEFRRMCDETFSLGLTEPEYRALFAEIDTANAGKLTIGNLIRAFAPAFAVAAETSFDATRPDTAEERKKLEDVASFWKDSKSICIGRCRSDSTARLGMR